MKTILLDIDYTLFCDITPRPYLKEFLDRLVEKYGVDNIYFYTGGNHKRITEVCRIMYQDLNINKELIRNMNNYSLHVHNCPSVTTNKFGTIEYKCLHKAAEVLNVSFETIILLDESPICHLPDQDKRIQAEGFDGTLEDKYLKNLEL